MVQIHTATKALGSRAARGLGWWFKLGLMGIFLTFIIFSAVVQGIEARDPQVTIDNLADRFLKPVSSINDISLEILSGESVGWWKSLLLYWNLFSSVYIIYLWLKILSKLIHYIFGDTTPWPQKHALTIGIFLAIIFLSSKFTGESLKVPIDAVKNLWRVMYNLGTMNLEDKILNNESIKQNITEKLTCDLNLSNSGTCIPS